MHGRIALVTGGTRGIGAAVCRRLIEDGARHVHCCYGHDDAAARRLAEDLGERADRVTVHRVDVCDSDALEGLVADTIRSHGVLEILVNCAGAPADRLLLRATPAHVRAALALNLESAIVASRAALASMLRHRYGRIVNVGSVVASVGNAGQSLYGAAKAALEGFTRSLAREVGAKGVTVNCVSPGYIATEQTAALPEHLRERFLEATAVGRPGTPEDVAHAVAFLCSQEAGYVTGTVLHVNGGMYM